MTSSRGTAGSASRLGRTGRYLLLRWCRSVPYLEDTVTCDVCRREFEPEHDGQRRCSELCVEIARTYKKTPTNRLYGIWLEKMQRFEPYELYCPSSGKRRYRKKRDAQDAIRKAVRERFSAAPDWLRPYYCDGEDGNAPCGAWHMTSKPKPTGLHRGRRNVKLRDEVPM